VLSMDEAETHPHARARNAFPEIEGVSQPAPGPRFSETPAEIRIAPDAASRSDPKALSAWGFLPDAIEALRSAGIVS
jgi:alpha-methylacyl-CoA racemase